jgi:hypothetical protein
MTDDSIEAKALALVNAVRAERGWEPLPILYRNNCEAEALCRAIEQHEAFKQEVSDAVEDYHYAGRPEIYFGFDHFIIPKPKPDPLVKAMEKMGWYIAPNGPADAEKFRAALDALGFEIREKGQ